MILPQLSRVLIFALVLVTAVPGNTTVNSNQMDGPAAETEAKNGTIAPSLSVPEKPPGNAAAASHSVRPEERIGTLEARLNQIELGVSKDAETSFWLKIVIFASSLLVLVLVTFSNRRLSSRINHLNRELEDVYRRLENYKSYLSSLQEGKSPPPRPVAWQRSSNPSHYFDDNVPKKDAVDHTPVDTSSALPPPPPPASRLTETAEELRGAIDAMIADPGMRVSAYEGKLTEFGNVFGLEFETGGQNVRLVAPGSGASRSLSAVVLKNQQEVIIVPSSRFVKDFSMTFKGILEAGNDTKTVFNCHTDGSGVLRVSCLATGQVDGDDIRNLQKGHLSGFVA